MQMHCHNGWQRSDCDCAISTLFGHLQAQHYAIALLHDSPCCKMLRDTGTGSVTFLTTSHSNAAPCTLSVMGMHHCMSAHQALCAVAKDYC